MKARAASAALLVCLSLQGCDLFVRRTAARGCWVNAECPNAICWFGECVPAEGTTPANLLVELTPPSTVNLLPQRRENVIPQAGRAPLQWRAQVPWRGKIILEDTRTVLAGSLRIKRPGTNATYTTPANYVVESTCVGACPSFEAFLEPGEYEGVFDVELGTRPSLQLLTWTVTEDDARVVSFIYPSSNVTTIAGRVRTSPENLTETSISDALVYARLDGSSLGSTLGRTDASGNFTLVMLGREGTYTLFIGPSAENPFVPEVTIAGKNVSEPLGDVFVGEIGGPVFVSGRVDGGGAPIGGARVRASAGSALGIHRGSAITGADGTFELTLIRTGLGTALDYQVIVQPPAASGFRTRETVYQVPASGELPALEVACEPGEILAGVVRDANDDTVGGAEVMAYPADMHRFNTVRTLTLADGSFQLALDAVDYTLEVTPAAGSRRPRLRVPLVDRQSGLVLKLPRAVLIAGEVIGRNDGFAGGRVKFLVPVDGQEILIGQALVDENNHYSVALPAASP